MHTEVVLIAYLVIVCIAGVAVSRWVRTTRASATRKALLEIGYWLLVVIAPAAVLGMGRMRGLVAIVGVAVLAWMAAYRYSQSQEKHRKRNGYRKPNGW